jgi:hypothetical protein
MIGFHMADYAFEPAREVGALHEVMSQFSPVAKDAKRLPLKIEEWG